MRSRDGPFVSVPLYTARSDGFTNLISGTVLLFLSPCFMKQGDRNKRTVPALHGKDSLFGKYLMTCLKG